MEDQRKCSNCVHVDKFRPRKDEIERGLFIGCKYPGFEGYTKDDAAEKCSFFCLAGLVGPKVGIGFLDEKGERK